MTEEQRYLFDLNGYLTVRGALPDELVRRLNAELDLIDAMSEEEAQAAGAARQTNGDRDRYGRLEHTRVLLPYGGVFESLIDPPATVPLVEEMIGGPLRLDAMHFMARTTGRGTVLHHGYSELLAYSEYALNRGRFECVSVKIGYALSDAGLDDGPFTVIPGSHKSNFAVPGNRELPQADDPLVEPVPVRAGDAVLFSDHPYADRPAEDVAALRPLPLAAGHALLYTEALSYALTAPRAADKRWLLYQYGPSYMLDWPDCTPSAALRQRAAADPIKAALLREPYYH